MVREPLVVLGVRDRQGFSDNHRVRVRHLEALALVQDKVDSILGLPAVGVVPDGDGGPGCALDLDWVRVGDSEGVDETCLLREDRGWPADVGVAAVLLLETVDPVEVRRGVEVTDEEHGSLVSLVEVVLHAAEGSLHLRCATRLSLSLDNLVGAHVAKAGVIRSIRSVPQVSDVKVELLSVTVESDPHTSRTAGSADDTVLLLNGVLAENADIAAAGPSPPAQSIGETRDVTAPLILLDTDDIGAGRCHEADLLVVVVGDSGATVPHVQGHDLEFLNQRLTLGDHRNSKDTNGGRVGTSRANGDNGILGRTSRCTSKDAAFGDL